MIKIVNIKSFEIGLLFRNGEFKHVLEFGRHFLAGFSFGSDVVILNRNAPWFRFTGLDQVVKAGVLDELAEFLDLNDNQRALVWRDERFKGILEPDLYGLWKEPGELKFEIVDIRDGRFVSEDLDAILNVFDVKSSLRVEEVAEGCAGVLLCSGKDPEVIEAGRYAFWKDAAPYTIKPVDLRETIQDVTGQEILTGDKVTVRVNASVSGKVVDPVLAVTKTANVWQSLYRDIQLALRAVVGTRDLNELLAGKEEVAAELEEMVRESATGKGIALLNVGIRDIILPGEMKELMNKVIQAQKAAEANLIARREEVAAMRSQANTARILEGNPTLMRLKELEVLESIAGNGKLEVILGEKGLADRVINLL